jgi:putative transposase
VVVDTLGLLMRVKVHPANVQDRDGARLVLHRLKAKYRRLKKLWADGAYGGELEKWVERGGAGRDVHLQIVKRSDAAPGFRVLPRRWVVERTFGWLGRWRRLSKDYEALPQTSEALIYLATISLLLRRLTTGAF